MNAERVPTAMSVSMLAVRTRALAAAALKNGQPHQNSTGTVKAAAAQRAHVSCGHAVDNTSTAMARGHATMRR